MVGQFVIPLVCIEDTAFSNRSRVSSERHENPVSLLSLHEESISPCHAPPDPCFITFILHDPLDPPCTQHTKDQMARLQDYADVVAKRSFEAKEEFDEHVTSSPVSEEDGVTLKTWFVISVSLISN